MFDVSFRGFYKESSERIYIAEEAEGVLKHLTHLEELVLTSKQQGLDIAIRFLKDLFSTFKSNSDSSTFVTVKFDGSPAVTAGINPENGQFFVSTKGLGNVTPKVNYTEEDIVKNHGHAPGLVEKLKSALKYLPAVIKDGVYQGDFLFDRKDLREENIDGQDLILFKPNTITYAVEKHSPLGQRILNSQIGVIFHTKYSGDSLSNLKRSSDVNVSEFNQTHDAFIDDAKFKDVSGMATFTKKESSKLEALLSSCETTGNRIKWDEIPDVVYTSLNTFINSLIRQGRFVEKPADEYENFIQWFSSKGQKAVDEMKTEKGRQKKQEGLQLLLTNLDLSRLTVMNLFSLTRKLEQAKSIFIAKYNSAIKTKQFLTQPDGSLQVTAPEGYVAVDHLGNMVKFVSRLDFSRANLSVSKGDKFK